MGEKRPLLEHALKHPTSLYLVPSVCKTLEFYSHIVTGLPFLVRQNIPPVGELGSPSSTFNTRIKRNLESFLFFTSVCALTYCDNLSTGLSDALTKQYTGYMDTSSFAIPTRRAHAHGHQVYIGTLPGLCPPHRPQKSLSNHASVIAALWLENQQTFKRTGMLLSL